jgi:CRP-like cAMP-binding protein
MNTSYLDLLRSKALFGGLEDKYLEIVVSLLRAERFPKNAVVMQEKEIGDKMYLITKGSVAVTKYCPEEKTNKVLSVLREGDSFGEMELVDIQPRTATVKALTDLETVSLGGHDLLKLSHEQLYAFAIIAMNIARIISRRLRQTDERLISILRN